MQFDARAGANKYKIIILVRMEFGLTEMFGSYVFDLFLLKSSTTKNFVEDEWVEDLNKFHEFDANISGKVLKWTRQSYVLLHDSLEIKCRSHDFVFSTRLSVITTACGN